MKRQWPLSSFLLQVKLKLLLNLFLKCLVVEFLDQQAHIFCFATAYNHRDSMYIRYCVAREAFFI